jgi:ribosomal protein S19E (S16A)
MHPDSAKAPPIKYAGSQVTTQLPHQPKVPSQIQNETDKV